MLSRLLGLVRDILFFSILGTSVIGEAFLLAFTLPNLFRRMLGEGTLTSAFIPVFSNSQKSKDSITQWALLNQVLSRLFLFLGILSIMVGIFSLFAYQTNFFERPKWHIANFFNGITFFYVIFICASAILVGALNVKKSFWAGALSPVILNCSMIITLFGAGFLYNLNFQTCALFLSVSVVVAGILQFLLPWYELKRRFHWKWRFTLGNSKELSEVGSLFWVGVFGAAIAQLNILVSRLLAFQLEDQGAVSYLYISARLIELPLGIFAIALSTILFPRLSKSIGDRNMKEYKSSFYSGLRIILMLSIPSSIGLFLVGDLVIKLLFEWKEFGGENVYMAGHILGVVAWSVPFYALSTFIVKSFHSQKNMSIPLKAALVSFIINLLASILLMQHFGVMGLAWANLLAAFFQLLYLYLKNNELSVYSFLSNTQLCGLKILFASLCMYSIVTWSKSLTQLGESKLHIFIQLTSIVLIGVISYLLILSLLKFPLMDGKPLLFRINRK